MHSRFCQISLCSLSHCHPPLHPNPAEMLGANPKSIYITYVYEGLSLCTDSIIQVCSDVFEKIKLKRYAATRIHHMLQVFPGFKFLNNNSKATLAESVRNVYCTGVG